VAGAFDNQIFLPHAPLYVCLQRVVSQHSWACDYLVLWDGRTYPTLRSLMLGETDDPGTAEVLTSAVV
jgi:hypothetical protein